MNQYRDNARRALEAGQAVLAAKGVLNRRDVREPGKLEKEFSEVKIRRIIRRVFMRQSDYIMRKLEIFNLLKTIPRLPPIDLLPWDDESEWQLIEELTKAVRGGVILSGFRQIKPDMVNIEALKWARKYASELIKEIDRTTLDVVKAAIGAFVETPGMTMGDLKAMLPFSAERADMIAVTEVTRAYAEGERTAAREMAKEFPGVPVIKTWFTNNDDLVCDICGPLENMTVLADEGFSTDEGEGLDGPPAHPNCRCWVSYRTDITRVDNG